MTRLDEAIRKSDQGKLQEGQRTLEQLRRELPHNPAVLYNLGMCYSEQGNLEASIHALERCSQSVLDHINTYLTAVFSSARDGHTNKALWISTDQVAKLTAPTMVGFRQISSKPTMNAETCASLASQNIQHQSLRRFP